MQPGRRTAITPRLLTYSRARPPLWRFVLAWTIIAGVLVYIGVTAVREHRAMQQPRLIGIYETGPLSAEEALNLLCSNIEGSVNDGSADREMIRTYELACLRGGHVTELDR